MAQVFVKHADISAVVSTSSKHLHSPAQTLDEVVRELEHLPSAPRVLPRLKQLLCDGNTAMSEVVEMVRLDPAIAARVLQFGNSAYFSHGVRCYTVEEAVGRVGYDHIYELVGTAVASQVLVRPLATYDLEADKLWANSIACALAAEGIADLVGADRNIAYTVGLLHSLGMLAIDNWAARKRPALKLKIQGLPLEACEDERVHLGFHQAEAGAMLLRAWAFPAAMHEPVRWQYLPSGTIAHQHLATVLHVAKWVRQRALGAGDAGRGPAPAALEKLRLGGRQLDRLTATVADKFSLINHQLEDETPAKVLRFPAGDRMISGRPLEPQSRTPQR